LVRPSVRLFHGSIDLQIDIDCEKDEYRRLEQAVREPGDEESEQHYIGR